jgi:hypothetical protein
MDDGLMIKKDLAIRVSSDVEEDTPYHLIA